MPKKFVDAESGNEIVDKEAAISQGIHVITLETYKNNQWVNADTGELVTNLKSAQQNQIKVIKRRQYLKERHKNHWVDSATGKPISKDNLQEATRQGNQSYDE